MLVTTANGQVIMPKRSADDSIYPLLQTMVICLLLALIGSMIVVRCPIWLVGTPT